MDPPRYHAIQKAVSRNSYSCRRYTEDRAPDADGPSHQPGRSSACVGTTRAGTALRPASAVRVTSPPRPVRAVLRKTQPAEVHSPRRTRTAPSA